MSRDASFADVCTPELAAILGATEDGLRVAVRLQRDLDGQALTKKDLSPVTLADFAVQAVMAARLSEIFPADPLVAEESASALRDEAAGPLRERLTSAVKSVRPEATPDRVMEWIDRGTGAPGARFWTLDPIDGTKGFLRRNQYVIALALIVEGEIRIGVLACPMLAIAPGRAIALDAPDARRQRGSLLVAVRGGGTWTRAIGRKTWERLSVSSQTNLKQAQVLRSVEEARTNEARLDRLLRRAGIRLPAVRMDSQVKYAVVASGQADLAFRIPPRPAYRENIWDYAAATVAVQEAGGRMTDLEGRELDFSAGRTLARNIGILASNGHLHEAALEVIARSE